MGVQEQVMMGGVLCVPHRTLSVTPGKGSPACRVFRLQPAQPVKKQILNLYRMAYGQAAPGSLAWAGEHTTCPLNHPTPHPRVQ